MSITIIIKDDSPDAIRAALKELLYNDNVKQVIRKHRVKSLPPPEIEIEPTVTDQAKRCANPDCGKEFTPARSDSKFCNSSCYQAVWRSRNKKQNPVSEEKKLKQDTKAILDKIRKEIPIVEKKRPDHYFD
ncbi:MAG: hypothetical protein WCL00_06080 [Bacteroidota bacterium]